MCFVAVNERWRGTFQVGDVEVHGKSLYDLIAGSKARWELAAQRCLKGESSGEVTSPWVRQDGQTDYLEWSMSPWRDQGDDIVGIVVHSRLVTERALTRLRLHEEEAFIRSLFDDSPLGMNLCRLDGLWLESNPAFLEIIGYSREEADGGLTYWQLTPDDYAEEEEAQLQSLEATGRYGPYNKEFIRKDGGRVPVRLNGFLLERGGEQFIWSLIEDMSKQRKLEQTIEAQRLQALHAAKLASIGEMAAGIAHEINNPLQIIDGMAFGVIGEVSEQQTEAHELLQGIRQATERAARIVRGLLRFAREGGGRAEAQLAVEIAQEGLSFTAERMRVHGVTIEHQLASRRQVVCNSQEMTQVLVNLLNNAFDAVRDQHGTVVLKLLDDGDDVIFQVSDDGPGVPEEIAAKIFEPFVTSKAHGTGLGLSICKGIVEASHGQLDYQRKQGLSQFTVRLPARERA